MDLDARNLPDGTRLEAQICIIGAGPAGISLARELMGLDLDVLMLESGGAVHEDRIQDLNRGTLVGEPYAGLRETRHRGVGGTVHLWNTPVGRAVGAKYVPLDGCDFEEWPFDRRHLEPFYRRAQTVCGLGAFAYEGKDWSDGRPPHATLGIDRLTTRVYQFGAARYFTERNLRDLRTAGNIRLCHHATACRLETNGAGRRVVGATIACLPGRELLVHSAVFVLAAGAIENARLLLSGGSGSDALGNRHGWVGRCFMEHPRDTALTLIPSSPSLFEEARFYDAHPARDGTIVGGRLGLPEQAIRSNCLPNASVTLLPRERLPPEGTGLAARVLARLRRLGRRPRGGYGWSAMANPSEVFDAFHLLVNVEQRPNLENRVVLAPTRDAFGVPRVVVHWRWREDEQANLERLRTTLARGIEEAGLGRVEIRSGQRPDPNAHHHAGTTRMHADPRKGAVDADGRVHGTDNLYATGASVFPTAGFANPTLTIVALALRLADHLKQRA